MRLCRPHQGTFVSILASLVAIGPPSDLHPVHLSCQTTGTVLILFEDANLGRALENYSSRVALAE